MSLSYYYELTAPATTTAAELEEFLRGVEQLAKSLGFAPTTVLNVPFDTKERREFARRLGGSFILQDEKLKGVALPAEGQVRDYDPISGECRLIPEHGVVLVLTDEGACETCFGFFKFPADIRDVHGRSIADTGFGGTWAYRDFIDSPDPRYREIVGRFEAAGYTKRVKDEFA
ncbi:MAG: hypothetical protein QOE70_1606 [Chthoniobacter sp.]|jgi:hypothetical protein|nr:hypothetical protein [Chthoniobacter sp.]